MTSHPDEYLAHLADGHALSPHDPSGHKLEDVLHDLLASFLASPFFCARYPTREVPVSFSGTFGSAFFTTGVFATTSRPLPSRSKAC